MKRVIFPACLCLLALTVSAQRELKNPLINSGEVIKKGVALHDAKDYKGAIKAYQTVPVSDTNYSSVLHELYLSAYADSNYTDAEKYALTGMELFPEKNTEWLGMLADVYDDTKRTDKALATYDTILAQNKYDYLAWFNRGISLLRGEKYDESINSFQHCILLNPYYSSAHYFLGYCEMTKGNFVPAMLSFCTNLLIKPGGTYQKRSISYLNTISEQNSTAVEFLAKYKPGKEDNFDALQDIITSKIALDRKYKLQADFDDKIVRQLQVMVEKLEFDPRDKGFWMQYYVPMFKKIWSGKNFEPFIFYIFSELDIKAIKDYTKRNKKEMEHMLEDAVAYLNGIRETQELTYEKREGVKLRYFISDYAITGKGAYKQNEKKENDFAGPWEFYHKTGKTKSTGQFDNEGLRTGEWRYNYESGLLKEVSNFKNGKLNGKSESWYDNGVKAITSYYKDDELDGTQTAFYYNNQPKAIVSYKNGKKNGVAKYFNSDGYLSTISTFKDGLYDGEETTYYESGKLQSKATYAADKAEGAYKELYEDGKVKKTGSYINDKKDGEWKSYFKNGQLELSEFYIKGDLDGEYSSFYEDGKPELKYTYSKGDVEGKTQHFDEDGVLYRETVFEKGRLRDIKFFDKKGQVISSTSSRKGNANVAFYLPDGTKSEEGYYTKDGLQDGKVTDYFRNGKASSESNYKKGLLDGKRVFYYANEKLNQEGNYSSGSAEGYFVNYFNNGNVSNEGWYVKGEKQGTFLYYNAMGDLTTKSYYLNDKIIGVRENYHPNGKMDYTDHFDEDWFQKIIQFDTTGKVLATSVLDKGEGKMLFLHYNGKPYIESNYKNYALNGMYKISNFDGSPRVMSYYKNGSLDSVYKAWYPNGKLQEEGVSKDGDKIGAWKNYWDNGQLMQVDNYVDGKLDGKRIFYNRNGGKENEMDLKKGTVNGEVKIFADNNQLAVVLYYKNDVLTGYSYEDKNGALVPVIALPKGQGAVTGYFRNGNKSVSLQYNESAEEGDRVFYYSNGKEKTVGKRANGEDVGVKKMYYPSGKLMKEENYVDGEQHGPAKMYAENGTLLYDVNYYNGYLHGDCKYYEAGKPVTTLVYYYGALEAKK